jgi:hypothetical protein
MSLEAPGKGVKGGRIDVAPRLPKATIGALNREYLAERNAALALKRRSAEIDLAVREGTLLPAGPLKAQLSFLLTSAREAVRAWHVRLPPLLLGQDLHRIGQILREAEGELLNTLAELPGQLAGGGEAPVEAEKPEPAPEEVARQERKRAGELRWNAIRRERRAAAKRGAEVT